ncbi:lipoprotein-releasing ABC transporter permease subunit [Zavarzinia sp. CC-PAN008]|uniref:lipoprotein-releasing ABC transporter permease subunit n=1 Tax=Zavarzinia sp. CC-PAN008 TaxID=3243332 RepID=UPI003F743A78
MNRFEWMLALRYLRARRQEGFISVIAGFSLAGIGLGVATLIIVMAVMNGFRAELLGRVLGLNGHMVITGAAAPLTDYDAIATRVRAVPGVREAFPIVEAQVMAMSQGRANGAMVRGMTAADLKDQLVAQKLTGGSLDAFGGDNILIGDRLARNLGLAVGDQLTIVAPQGTATAFGTAPRLKAYTVAATFNIGMYEYDSSYVFMGMEQAQVFFRMGGAASAIEVKVEDPDRTSQFIGPVYRAAYSAETPVGVADWQQMNANFFSALQVERNVMFLILTLIILVAAFNIISSLIMLVKDKTRDIAILRTMGAARGSIMRVFVIAGSSVGVIGTFAGFVLGVLFCENIESIRQGIQAMTGWHLFPAEVYFLSQLPAKMEWHEVGYVVAMGLGLSFLATLYPSWRAARLDPVEALRYE